MNNAALNIKLPLGIQGDRLRECLAFGLKDAGRQTAGGVGGVDGGPVFEE